ncbi:hypothetical protein ZIOFF_025390 [Zingiber officinale]|uniref:Uncharacterized protein n=1 Tax=Zingiber officinale TaxID=94328 RepID=A0A8J5LH17_ZINOF|nr:hypothetical protein ZIOFF_025390 [Zingiber officinale]
MKSGCGCGGELEQRALGHREVTAVGGSGFDQWNSASSMWLRLHRRFAVRALHNTVELYCFMAKAWTGKQLVNHPAQLPGHEEALGAHMLPTFKQAVRITKVRIEQIKKKKKQAVVCINKKDVAGLVAGCWQANVFKRVEFLSFYSLLSPWFQSCKKQKIALKKPWKQHQPLIFAAAKFHGLPELRDLRSLFAKREWKCMESSVNSELELMKNIADEFDRPKEIVLPQHEEINDVVQKHTRDSFDPDNIEAHRSRKFDEKCELPQSMAEDHHELDCSVVEKEAIDRTRGKVEDQLNKNTSGRYVNPPYLVHPKTSDTTNKVGDSQIEKPMPRTVRRNSKEPIICTKDDAVSINKPAKAKATPH